MASCLTFPHVSWLTLNHVLFIAQLSLETARRQNIRKVRRTGTQFVSFTELFPFRKKKGCQTLGARRLEEQGRDK